MVKKSLLGFSLAVLCTTGALVLSLSMLLLCRAHAQSHVQSRRILATSTAATAFGQPVTLEMRDQGRLWLVVHAEGGIEDLPSSKPTKRLRDVTIIHFNAAGRVSTIDHADSIEAQPFQWTLHQIHTDTLSPQPAMLDAPVGHLTVCIANMKKI